MKHTIDTDRIQHRKKRGAKLKTWFLQFDVRAIILILILLLCITLILIFAGQMHKSSNLNLTTDDIIVTQGEDDTLDLWIRQKRGIESVMITKQIIDYGTGTGHYATIDPHNLLASEGEKRFSDGMLLAADERGTVLVDSTVQQHPTLGAAYHLRLPRQLLYQTNDGNYHTTTLSDGYPLTITTFSKDFADYRGEYRTNLFTLHAPWWTADDYFVSTDGIPADSTTEGIDAAALAQRLRSEFGDLLREESKRNTELVEASAITATDLANKLAELQGEVQELSAQFSQQLASQSSEGLLIVSSLQNEIDVIKAGGSANAGNKMSLQTSECDREIQELTERGVAEVNRLDEKIETLANAGAAKAEELEKAYNMGITSVNEVEVTLQKLEADGSNVATVLREEYITKISALEQEIGQLQATLRNLILQSPSSGSNDGQQIYVDPPILLLAPPAPEDGGRWVPNSSL